VHQIYELSGFPYPYASSFDLYDGVDNFRRVSTPHPGDLVVWRGHVGIAIDAVKHTFYSSVRSGLRTEYYDGLTGERKVARVSTDTFCEVPAASLQPISLPRE